MKFPKRSLFLLLSPTVLAMMTTGAAPAVTSVGAYSVQCDIEEDTRTCYGVCELLKGESRGETCHCIPDHNQKCPPRPPSAGLYDPTLIFQLSQQVANNPFQLNCDPFVDPSCQTDPPQEFTGHPGEVCGLLYESNDPCSTGYSMKTYTHVNKAVQDGAVVTHVGACGVCSTTQDLAAFLKNPNPEQALIGCALYYLGIPPVFDLTKVPLILQCLIGATRFTNDCALLWLFNGFATFRQCYAECLPVWTTGLPPNDEHCQLNPCLQCDEEKIFPTYARFAGRRRGRTGLLAMTVRSCSELASIEHDECSSVVTDLHAGGLRG